MNLRYDHSEIALERLQNCSVSEQLQIAGWFSKLLYKCTGNFGVNNGSKTIQSSIYVILIKLQ